MNIETIGELTNEELSKIWESFSKLSWNSKTMYNEELSIDDYGMLIYNEMYDRRLKTPWE